MWTIISALCEYCPGSMHRKLASTEHFLRTFASVFPLLGVTRYPNFVTSQHTTQLVPGKQSIDPVTCEIFLYRDNVVCEMTRLVSQSCFIFSTRYKLETL